MHVLQHPLARLHVDVVEVLGSRRSRLARGRHRAGDDVLAALGLGTGRGLLGHRRERPARRAQHERNGTPRMMHHQGAAQARSRRSDEQALR